MINYKTVWKLVKNLNYWQLAKVAEFDDCNSMKKSWWNIIIISNSNFLNKNQSYSSVNYVIKDPGEKRGSCDHIYGVCKNEICSHSKINCKLLILKTEYFKLIQSKSFNK